jgi:nucleotide-binding universal stress UspA family protein
MLPKYKTILLAIDLSENSAYALRHAIAIAQQSAGQVHLIHVLPDVEPAVLNYVATVMGAERLADYELEHKEEIRDEMRVAVHKFATEELLSAPETVDFIHAIHVHHGSPAFATLELAETLDADLIVVGSHSKGKKIRHAFLGSMAKLLLRKSTRPVLVVPLSTTLPR